mmetsp:Transcript_12527/g.16184  ORF Transcript_12527/g.16184 Transcript_12527/m.16184 type:complete len:569 (+) Transcript_12527:190-1896(+)
MAQSSGETEFYDIEWDDLDKSKFFFYGTTLFFGVRALFYPPTLIKTRMQVDTSNTYKNSFDAAKKIIQREGPKGMFKGFWISSANLIFRQAYFTTFEVVRKHLGPESKVHSLLGPKYGEMTRNLAAGFSAQVVFQSITVPLDVVTQRLMVAGAFTSPQVTTASSSNPGKIQSSRPHRQGTVSMIRLIWAKHGWQGFYRGYSASILQFAPNSAIWWTAYGAYLQPVNSVFDALFPLTQDQKNNTASRDFRQQIVQNLQTKDVVVQKTSQVLGLSVTAAEGIIRIKSIADSPMPGIAGNLEVGDQILRLNNVHYSTGIDMIAAIRHIQIGDNMVFTIRIQSKEGVGKSLQQARQEAQMKARLAAAKRANEISQPSAKQQQQLQRYQESLTRALARVQKTILQQQSNGRPLAHLQSYQESLTRALADLQQKHLQQQCNARPLECLQRMRLLSSSFKHTQPSMMRSYKLASKRPESENNLGEVASHRKKRRKTAQHQVQIEDGWSCHACTYFNVIAKTICQMCYSPKDKESIGGGWACEACTFDNLAGDIKCGLCEAPKQQVHRSGVCIDLT